VGRFGWLLVIVLVASCVRQGFERRSVSQHDPVDASDGVSDTDGPPVLEVGADIPADGNEVPDSLLPDLTLDTFAPDASAGHSVLFVTKSVYRPGVDFKSIAGADALCLQVAKTAKLTGTILALISDVTTNAATRATLGYPVQTTNGDVIAATDLFSGAGILNRVRDEDGALSENYVWTGSNEYGVNPSSSAVYQHCDNWANWQTMYRGITGLASSTGANWLGHSGASGTLCNNSAALYCVSVP
jgi:hypothetical protein